MKLTFIVMILTFSFGSFCVGQIAEGNSSSNIDWKTVSIEQIPPGSTINFSKDIIITNPDSRVAILIPQTKDGISCYFNFSGGLGDGVIVLKAPVKFTISSVGEFLRNDGSPNYAVRQLYGTANKSAIAIPAADGLAQLGYYAPVWCVFDKAPSKPGAISVQQLIDLVKTVPGASVTLAPPVSQ